MSRLTDRELRAVIYAPHTDEELDILEPEAVARKDWRTVRLIADLRRMRAIVSLPVEKKNNWRTMPQF